MVAAFEETVWSRTDWPPIITQWPSPAVFLKISSTLATTFRVRACEAASGSWMPTIA